MPEPAISRPTLRPVALAAGCGVLLAGLAGFGGIVAALAGALAQPAFALAVSWQRGTRGVGAWRRDALALCGLWFGGLEFVLEVALTPERRLAREDAAVVRENLVTRGFHLQFPPASDLDPMSDDWGTDA